MSGNSNHIRIHIHNKLQQFLASAAFCVSVLRQLMLILVSWRQSKMLIFPERSSSPRCRALQHTTHTLWIPPTISALDLPASAAAYSLPLQVVTQWREREFVLSSSHQVSEL